jgi:putative ABC transport system permease protein
MTTGVPEQDQRMLYANVQTAQELMQTNKVSTLSLYLKSTEDTDSYHASLQAEHPDLAWQTWLDTAYYYLGVKGNYDRIFGLLGVIIMIMVFFSISNTVSMSVVERTREIGTLRAIGAYPREVNRSLAIEGFLIGLAGSFIGLLLGWLISVLLTFANWQMPPPPGRSEGYPLAIDIPVSLYAAATVLSVTVCMLAAWLSARKATSRPIVEALSHV